MKKVIVFILSLILSGALTSCSTSRHKIPAYGYEPTMGKSSSDFSVASEEVAHDYEENSVKKILFSAVLLLTVEIPDSTNFHIEKIARKYNGYVNEIGTFRTIIRVESNKLNDAIQEISALGKVQNKNLTGQDVTEEYLDYKIRLENAEKSRKRYLELLAKAENVEAALKVERELERLNASMDLLKGKMNRIDHLSEFSTITINLRERKKPGPIGYVGMGLYHAVKWLFVRN